MELNSGTMSLACHVTHKDKKNIVKGNTSREIMDNIKKAFDISCEIIVQKYFTEFNDWVDVEATEIENLCRLKVFEQQTKPEVDLLLTGGMCVDEPGVHDLEMSIATKTLQRHPTGSNDEESSQEDNSSHVTSIRQAGVKLSTWPVPFKLPVEKYRPNLKAALSAMRPLLYAEKQCLLDALYDDMTRYTFRPSSQHYQEAVTTVLRAYPWLKNGLVGQDAVDYWKKSLSNKFRNERKRHEKENPLAQPPKKKTPASTSSQAKRTTDKGKSLFGIKNYLPPRPEGEDNETIAEHIKILKSESRKKRQDLRMVKELMAITLAERRKQIVSHNWTVKQIKEEYPCLFDEDEMLAEFSRLTEGQIYPRMEAGLAKYGNSILNSKGATLKEEVEALSSLASSFDIKQRIRSYGALMLLPQLLGEKFDTLVSPQSKKHESPDAHIQHTADDNQITHLLGDKVQFTLVAEGEPVCTTESMIMAFCLLVCIHYAFNLMYDKKVHNTLTFLQKILINLVDESTTPAKVVRLIYNLNTILTNANR